MEGNEIEECLWSDGSVWQHMPDDLIIYIFAFLDCNSLLQASMTCMKWRRIAFDESLWKDLVSDKVSLPRTHLPSCQSWYEEFRRLCMNVPSVESEVLKGHEDEVYHVMFSPSGKYFSTSGKDGTVIIWELGMPTKMFTKTEVIPSPSYTRYSEFNQSETKLLVAGIDNGYFFDGFIKIYEFGKELVELCLVRVEFPNFRGTWLDDDIFISMARVSDETNGHYLQVRAHKGEKKICQHEYQELIKINHSRHRNDFVRVVDKTKWPVSQENISGENCAKYDLACSSKRLKQEDSIDIEVTNTKSIVLSQTSTNYKSALYQYDLEGELLNSTFTPPKSLYKDDVTIIGTNLSQDHRYLAYAVRQKVDGAFHEYSESIEVRVHDLQNNVDTEEVYRGASACGTDHVSYIFPSVSKDFVACGSENLKGYIWDRNHRILLSTLNHESGVHSQNGVNATAFCPTDQEVLVTVADDLNVRVWRSKQSILDSKQIFEEFDLTSNELDDKEDTNVTCCSWMAKAKKGKKIAVSLDQ